MYFALRPYLSSHLFKHPKPTFVNAINAIRCKLTIIVEDLLELGGFGSFAYTWLDGLTHFDLDDVTRPEIIIQPFVSEDPAVSANLIVQREVKSLKTLQLSFLWSKLYLGPDDTPYPPMIKLMDSTLAVSLSDASSLLLHSFFF